MPRFGFPAYFKKAKENWDQIPASANCSEPFGDLELFFFFLTMESCLGEY